MSMFAQWSYRVDERPERAKFSRPPNMQTEDPGEVSEFAFTVKRGSGDNETWVEVTVTREEVIAQIRDIHASAMYQIDAAVCRSNARSIARRKAHVEFLKHDRTISPNESPP